MLPTAVGISWKHRKPDRKSLNPRASVLLHDQSLKEEEQDPRHFIVQLSQGTSRETFTDVSSESIKTLKGFESRIANLQPAASYALRVLVSNSRGSSGPSKVITFKTPTGDFDISCRSHIPRNPIKAWNSKSGRTVINECQSVVGIFQSQRNETSHASSKGRTIIVFPSTR